MTSTEKQARAAEFSQAGRYREALVLVCELLAESDSSEHWNDWAAVQFRLQRNGDAEAGFLLALQKDPTNTQAALNLGALLHLEARNAEAVPWLALAAGSTLAEERQAASVLQTGIENQSESRNEPSSHEIEAYLRRFLSNEANERSYFETHVRRYVATLQMLPGGVSGARILELGAAFHHVTPALAGLKNYGEVRCNDIWRGEAQQTRLVQANDGGQTCSFVVDNFDVQHAPWPYADQTFDAVLCCEMLEHLHSDPMCLFAELNRVLKPGGVLLLTTPNIAGAHALEYAMRGESPYVYGKFERDGAATDRHNREYTVGEVQRLAQSAGLEPIHLRTRNSWWSTSSEVMRNLALQGHSIAHRGDNTFLLARKHEAVRERYPEEFYQVTGTQSDRRALQAADTVSTPTRTPNICPPQNILLIHEVLPHHDCSGSDLRLLDVIRELRAEGHRVTLLARSDKNAARYRPDLEALGVRVCTDRFEPSATSDPQETGVSLGSLVENERFDIAIVCHWFWAGISLVEQYLIELRRVSPQTRILILSDDRHGERERRAAEVSGLWSDLERGNSFEQREIEAYRQADLVLYITEADHQWFLKLAPQLETMHLPMLAEVHPPPAGWAGRDGLLFLGNFDNPANVDALQWMLSSVWPLVRKALPDVVLYIVGHGASQREVQGHEQVVCLGQVEDLSPVFDARRVFASPVRYGTGINTKNLQALSRGLPLVATSVGVEGLRLQDEVHGLVADSPEAFAQKIVRLYQDEQLWTTLARNGQSFVRENFSREHLRTQLGKIIRHARRTQPRVVEPGFCWSYRRVEQSFPGMFLAAFPHHRFMLRIFSYWLLGRQYIDQAQCAAALEQFRHIFTLTRGTVPGTVFHRELLADMARCYQNLGDLESSERCLRERVNQPDDQAKKRSQRLRKSDGAPSDPEISVVLPTFNRPETLAVSLVAWAFQTLPVDRWELVVVDDGSSDETRALCSTLMLPYRLRHLRQDNQGAGAARRAGVKAATGEYLLLCNDDTIPDSRLLSEHLGVHRRHPHEKWAVLGDFRGSRASARRALSFFVNTSAFFFPQQGLQPGQLLDQAYFVTCNLSVRRAAVLAAGNFDAQFRVAEDTELGTRLMQLGYRVRYHPAARADHEHGTFATSDLIARARAYGGADMALFAKHPHLLGSGQSPFGLLTPADVALISQGISEKREMVRIAVEGLEALDQIDFLPCFKREGQQRSRAEAVLEQLAQVVPMVYWQYLLESFVQAWTAASRDLERRNDNRQPEVIGAP